MQVTSDIPEVATLTREEQVRAAIASVRDPEIDETVASLDFIVAVTIDGDDVEVALRLPTFWCPANFVYLMADDMRGAVIALDWVRSFRLRLVDHFAENQINRGINEGLPFEAVFPSQAGNRIGDLRRSFDQKTFLMRQGTLVQALRRSGFSDEFLAAATIGEIDAIARTGTLERLWIAYLEKRGDAGLAVDRHCKVVVNGDGQPVSDLSGHLRKIRAIATNAGANGEMCRMLVAARREGEPRRFVDVQPTTQQSRKGVS
jgi:metal-sulfur cluster biosynthetic enzyme